MNRIWRSSLAALASLAFAFGAQAAEAPPR